MEREQLLNGLKAFIQDEVLGGQGQDIDGDTPLWEWGLIDSFSLFSILAHVEKAHGVTIPPGDVKAEDFTNLQTIADLVLRAR